MTLPALTAEQNKLAYTIGSFIIKQPAMRIQTGLIVSSATPGVDFAAMGIAVPAISEVFARVITAEIDRIEAFTGRTIEREIEELRFSFPEDNEAISARGPIISGIFGEEDTQSFSEAWSMHVMPAARRITEAAHGTDRPYAECVHELIENLWPSFTATVNRPLMAMLTLPLIVRHYYPHAGEFSRTLPHIEGLFTAMHEQTFINLGVTRAAS